jgi:hypothetical protein
MGWEGKGGREGRDGRGREEGEGWDGRIVVPGLYVPKSFILETIILFSLLSRTCAGQSPHGHC